MKASDNLRWTLGGGMAAADDKPLGKTAPPAQVASATGTATGSPEKGASGVSQFHEVARVTGLEPATSGVTGRRSNQLSYTRVFGVAAT